MAGTSSRTDEPAEAVLRRLVTDQFSFVWRSLLRLGVPRGEAEDATQQVFLVASRKLDRIEAGAERAFLFGTAIRIASRFHRGRSRRREVPLTDLEVSDPAPGPDEQLDRARARSLLSEILDRLSLDLRSVFVLHEIEQFTAPEIATALGLPLGTVASRLRRSRAAFRAELERIAARELESARDEAPPRGLLARVLVTVGVTSGLAAASGSAQAASALIGLGLGKWLAVAFFGGLVIAGVQASRDPAPPGPGAPGVPAAPGVWGVPTEPEARHSEMGRVLAAAFADAHRSGAKQAHLELPVDAAPTIEPSRASSRAAAAPKPQPSATRLLAPPEIRVEAAAMPAPDLAAETAVLDKARQALASGQARGALALLDRHAREFPTGRLQPEAEVTRIEAVAQSDPKAAAAMARTFLAQHPRSPHAERVGALVTGDRRAP